MRRKLRSCLERGAVFYVRFVSNATLLFVLSTIIQWLRVVYVSLGISSCVLNQKFSRTHAAVAPSEI